MSSADETTTIRIPLYPIVFVVVFFISCCIRACRKKDEHVDAVQTVTPAASNAVATTSPIAMQNARISSQVKTPSKTTVAMAVPAGRDSTATNTVTDNVSTTDTTDADLEDIEIGQRAIVTEVTENQRKKISQAGETDLAC